MSKIKFYTSDDQVYFEMEEEQPMNKEQKIQELTERMEKSQAEIDELKQELERLKKKPYEISYPKDGEKVYSISRYSNSIIEYLFDVNNKVDQNLHKTGQCFGTKKEAEQFLKEQTLIKKIKCYTKEQQGNWEPDWRDLNQRKYYIEIDRSNKSIFCDWSWEYDKLSKLPCFKSQEILEACIDEFGDEILEVFC